MSIGADVAVTVDDGADVLARAGLAAWRDAALGGDLPLPERTDRWQPLRAGVVNLWEYDAAEVWYADGRMQLQGANESGKSTLMTLTTLLLLAGDTSSRNIDTLGESGKRFRYYVEPTNHPLDRRDATKQKHRGWAWQEYGRIGPLGPEYFTTLLFAEARRADADLKPQWCTLHGGGRVRSGLTLVTGGLVAEPTQLKDIAGFTSHKSGTAYREEIARALFDTGLDWLDQVIRILRVVRTPKIGDRLDLTFLTTAFRNALPPLAEDEIRQLADGWDQLERLRNERDTAEQALAAVSEFTRRQWRPWADAVIRSTADPVTAAFTAFDNVTREERAARTAATALNGEVAALDVQAEAAQALHERKSAEVEALQQDQAYQDAVAAVANAEQLAERASTAAGHAARSAKRMQAAEEQITPAREAVDAAAETMAGAQEQADAAAGAVAGYAEGAGLVDVTARFLPSRDVVRMAHAAEQRQGAVTQLMTLVAEYERAAAKADEAERTAQQARETAEAAADLTQRAGEDVEAQIAAVAAELTGWANGLAEDLRPSPSLIEAWVRLVTALIDAAQPAPILGSAIVREHLDPRTEPLRTRRAELSSTLRLLDDQLRAVRENLAVVEQERDPRPEDPHLWRRRTRPEGVSAEGAPLWRLVEIEDPDHADLATLEATLDACGLLQAWITPDGAYLGARDDADTVWIIPDHVRQPPTQSLRAVLRPADDAGALHTIVDELLRSVSFGQTQIDDGVDSTLPRLAADGHWRHGVLAGLAAPIDGGARLLGAAARAVDRQRRIAALRDDLDRLTQLAEATTAELNNVEQTIAALAQARTSMPGDSLVVAAVLTLRQAEQHANRLAQTALDAGVAATRARTDADTQAAAVATHADEHNLPRYRAEADLVREALRHFTSAVERLANAIRLLPQLERALSGQQDTLQRLMAAAQVAAGDAARDAAEANRLAVMAQAAKSALSQDASQILERVGALRGEVKALDEQARKRARQRDQLVEKKIKAESQLERAEASRRDAETVRQTAVDAWFACIDTGLPRQRGLSDPPARHITAALDTARVARAHIDPRDWSDDPHAAGQRVQAQWARMTEAAQPLRSRLESLAGRTVRTTLPGDNGSPGSVQIVVDGTGVALPPPHAVEMLDTVLTRLRADYDEELTKTINELLGSTFIEHLRDRLAEAERLRSDINTKLSQTPTTTSGLMLRLVRVAVDEERAANEILAALERDFAVLPAGAQEQIRQFLARRIGDAQEAARASGDPDWRTRLGEILDYRRWFELRLEYRTPQATTDGGTSNWRPLNRDDHSLLSGGAKVVTLLQPFVAALHAMYDQSGIGPRMMWLDEAFDGVDPSNRATMLRLLADCDLDWIVAGPGPIVNATTVRVAAIYEVRRAPRPDPGVSLELAVWAGGAMTHLATPDPADLPDLAHPTVATPAAVPDLFSDLHP
jgi:uncharacterized protein (TIGR02680 family)